MFDILAKLAELLMKAVSNYSERRDIQRTREFGQELVTCYLRLLEVIYAGRAILKELEYFQRRFDQNLKEKGDWYFWRTDLTTNLEKQALNLMRLGRSIQDVAKAFHIFEPELAIKLGSLVYGKMNAIAELASVLRSGEYPIKFDLMANSTEEEFRALISEIRETSIYDSDSELRLFASEVGEKAEIDIETISTIPEWGIEEFKKLQSYLNLQEPAERIQKLEECAAAIRKLLLESFELKDILWSLDKFKDKTGYLF